MHTYTETFDIIIVGAGHAGIEAALAAARLGCKTLCLCTDLDAVGNMACNPSIGGTAKGQLVREIDALGGEMAKAADATCLQFRMLNRGKGPAVHSPRCQSDRMAYRAYMRAALERQENLALVQGECSEVLLEDGAVCGVAMASGLIFSAKAVVLATGTYLKAKTFVGSHVKSSGPDGMHPADLLSRNLEQLGLKLRRFKTGTPPRIDGRTVDYTSLTPQPGDSDVQGFSFDLADPPQNKVVCHLAYTNETTHREIRASLHRSPLYGGAIEGIGPRYCPSIEDKIVRFADKPKHQLFLEPCGENSCEIYVQGLSTSMPIDVQMAFVRTVHGLENARIMRPGYAIEYDCIDPLQLRRSLEVSHIPGLFAAGQLCGSSGYEEAAAQGLVAGVNAAHRVLGRPPFTLERSDGYIGTLIDDLVTSGTNEPYRMMTSRCEHRLIARQDNADRRLMPYGHQLGLVSAARLENMRRDCRAVEEEIARLNKTIAPPSEKVNSWLEGLSSAPLELRGASFAELLRRPEISYRNLEAIDPAPPDLSEKVAEQVEILIKYEGYIKRQAQEIENARRLEGRRLPEGIDYLNIRSIRTEARQKLDAVRPETLGQASRISGVSPSDIGALIVWLSTKER